MKAILVVDVPTDSLDNVIASVNICEQREGYNIILKRMGKMSLKPLPHKLQAEWYTDGYKEGFNACLDEITGETECITQKKDTLT